MGGDESGFFDTRRATDCLGLSHRTLDGYSVSGEEPAFHRFGNWVRNRRLDLDAWAAQRRAAAEADRQGAMRSKRTGRLRVTVRGRCC